MNQELEKLKGLTEFIPTLDAIVRNDSGDVVEYDVANGVAIAFDLYTIDKISVDRIFFSKGVIFPTHAHESTEWFIVYDGHVIVRYEDKEVELREGDSLCHGPGVPHSAEFFTNTWMLVVSVPAASGYAGGRKGKT